MAVAVAVAEAEVGVGVEAEGALALTLALALALAVCRLALNDLRTGVLACDFSAGGQGGVLFFMAATTSATLCDIVGWSALASPAPLASLATPFLVVAVVVVMVVGSDGHLSLNTVGDCAGSTALVRCLAIYVARLIFLITRAGAGTEPSAALEAAVVVAFGRAEALG